MASQSLRMGLLIFPDLTQLDLTGPYEILTRVTDAEVLLVAKTLDPVRSDHGLTMLPMVDFANCPPLDLIFVPGGSGINALLDDPETLSFIRERAAQARWIVGVCTGSLVLGAAGLLRGRKATTHWMSHEMLSAFGAERIQARVVRDGNLFTGGGVTAGIDVALTVAAEIGGEDAAKAIQLMVEYDPQPPFDAGSPAGAGPQVLDVVMAKGASRQQERAAGVRRAAEKLALAG